MKLITYITNDIESSSDDDDGSSEEESNKEV